MTQEVSVLGPVDPASVQDEGQEKAAPWIVRKLVGSMTGRIVMSSWETLRASGTNIVCLSPWGDSSPLLLPCIRFRDLAVHSIIAATGGMAAVAAPVMGPVSDAIMDTAGDGIFVEIGMHASSELTTELADHLGIEKPFDFILPIHSDKLQTTGIKELLITLKYKHIHEDALLGFYRGSLHRDSSLFSSVMGYLSTQKGWFSPYLFASGRRPIIPRSMKPDVVFCHGPFLPGDYQVGQALLAESALVISLAPAPPATPSGTPKSSYSSLSIPNFKDLSLSNMFSRSRTPSPVPSLTPLPSTLKPRRMVVLLVGLKPHRAGIWTSSQRPSESVIYYQLLNGCPTIVIPVKLGAPLLGWDTLTLDRLWKVTLPKDGEALDGTTGFSGIVKTIFEYLDLCVDWGRVVLSTQQNELDVSVAASDTETDVDLKKIALKDALSLLVAGAVRSGESEEVKKKVDKDRSGIAMWRIP
ncbi:uncharacterized protein PHACADRAFT_172219 [Phanerochaete carnosa HHB-10118-sp]|uniref:Uncharacterized protein n=1 Tax=Phanerochaete carnosa (strain HHB-10118-sp) TaxID=650164 RepID=K5WC24_PHACS|nr:uncharacterized protein PHACADRAFT_172219 [Phanerochaete carnosa HHB-10118-sp]EKM56539.1 hypothetical protein PHACADRAFT_172219 [Phanerochaete carnosa HHB-10118-sp]